MAEIITLSPEARKASEEFKDKAAKEQEDAAMRDFQKFCEDRGVVPMPIQDFRFQGGQIFPINITVGFISKLRIPEEKKNG